MLNKHNTGLIVIDVQGKLASLVADSEAMLANIEVLIQGCKIVNLPIVWLEQNPQGLGATVAQISQHLHGDNKQPNEAIVKHTFSGCGSSEFVQAVADSNVKQWLVCGIEAHICVYQTAYALLEKGYDIEVVVDCVSSRDKANKDLAIDKLKHKGGSITSVEMCLYELIEDSRNAEFKQILSLIK
ncbi:hydrolase [Thalassotalea crassostreae]|uniref:hydrolase n=1 Tax=Thalassotalea crassostreae TaxID=1763536 RepID=UPI0008387EA2|nr:hydrolase [Thalassotalea crassostreae]